MESLDPWNNTDLWVTSLSLGSLYGGLTGTVIPLPYFSMRWKYFGTVKDQEEGFSNYP
jgi:hypothetical protein